MVSSTSSRRAAAGRRCGSGSMLHSMGPWTRLTSSDTRLAFGAHMQRTQPASSRASLVCLNSGLVRRDVVAFPHLYAYSLSPFVVPTPCRHGSDSRLFDFQLYSRIESGTHFHPRAHRHINLGKLNASGEHTPAAHHGHRRVAHGAACALPRGSLSTPRVAHRRGRDALGPERQWPVPGPSASAAMLMRSCHAQLIPSMLMHEGRHLSYLDPSNSASSSTQVLPTRTRH